MAPDYRSYLVAQGILKAAQQQAANDRYNQFLASRTIQPGTGPVQTPVQRSALVPQNVPVGNPVPVTPLPAPRRSVTDSPIDFGGGGSGVTANDILGQFGPVVVGPQYRKPEPLNIPNIAPPEATAGKMVGYDANTPSMLGDPLYTKLIYEGATPAQAMQLVLADRESKATQAAQTQAMTTLSEPSGGLDPVGNAIITGSAPILKGAKIGLDKFAAADDYTRLKVQEGLAWTVYGNVKRMHDDGATDQEIMDVLNSDSLMKAYIPQKLWDASPEEQHRFITGLLDAYEKGYTAYGRAAPLGGVGMGGSYAEPVAHFDPGARAAHEFIAGERGWIQRTINDLAEAPFNWAFGPARGTGEKIAKYGEELTARSLAEEGAAAAAKRAAGKTLTVTGKAAAVPDIVLNKAADNVVNEVIGTFTDALGGLPGPVGRFMQHLADTPNRIKARTAGEDYLDAARIADEMEKGGPGAVSPTKPPPYSGPVPAPLALPSGELPSPVGNKMYGPMPEPGDPRMIPPLPEGFVDSSVPGTGQKQYGPNVYGDMPNVGLGEDLPPDPTMADVPSLTEMGGARQQRPTVMPEDRNAAIKAGDVNAFDPYENGRRIVDDAAAAGRTGDPQKAAAAQAFETANAGKRADAWAIDRSLEEKANALRAQLDQYDANGKRIYMPQGERDAIFKQVNDIKNDQLVNGIEHTVYDVADDYVTHIGNLPEIEVLAERSAVERAARGDETLAGLAGKEPTPKGQRVIAKAGEGGPVYEIGPSRNKVIVTREGDGYTATYKGETATGLTDAEAIAWAEARLPEAKPSFMAESNAYLAQRYVFAGDEDALKILTNAKRQYPLTAEQAQRLTDARNALVDLQDISTTRMKAAKFDAERQLAVDASKKNVLQKVDQRLAATKTAGSSSPMNKEYRAMRAVATQAESLDDGVSRLTDYGTGAYDDRELSVTLDPSGKPVYDKTTPEGRGWSRVDQVIELFKKWWTEAQRTHAVDPKLRRAFRLDQMKVELPKPERVPLRDPSIELPEDVRRMMDEEKFTQHERFKDMTFRQVRDTIERETTRDQKRAQSLAKMGYEPAPSKKSSKFVPAPGEMTVIVGETTPVKPGGKTKPITQRRPVAGTWDNPNEELWSLTQKYDRYGDILTSDPHEMANELAARAKEFDIHPELARHPPLAIDLVDAVIHRLPRHLLLADPITSWGYTGRNIIGNIETAGLGTQGESFGRILESFRTAANETESMAETVTRDLGLGRAPSQYTKQSITAVDVVERGSHTPTRQLAERLHLGKVASAFDKKRSIDAAIEYGFKLESGYTVILQGNILESAGTLANEMAVYASRRGIPLNRDEIMDLLLSLRKADSRVFNNNDVYDGIFRLAKGKGVDDETALAMAKDASRKWKGHARRAQLDAIDQTNRIFPSQRRLTNFDHYLTYATLFHFWPTRTAKLVLEEAIRNPQLINLWRDAHQGLARMAEEGNYPLAVRMLMRIGASPLGFMLYFNPASLFLITALNPERPDAPDPRNVTAVGSFLRDMRDKTGLGPTPFMDAVLNVAGIYGDSFPPNPWPSRTAELAGAVYDAVLIQLGHHPGTPVYDNAMAWLRSKGSGIIPGTTNIAYKDQRAYTLDLVGSMVLEMNPQLAVRMQQVDENGYPTPDATAARAEFDAIMQDPDSPAYNAAEKRVAWQSVITKGLNGFSPLTVVARIQGRDQTIEASHAGFDSENPTPGQQGAANLRGDVTATNTSRPLDIAQDQYQQIGTPRQQSLSQYWSDVVYNVGDRKFDGQVLWISDKEFIRVEDLRKMDVDQRKEIANRWIAALDGTDDLKAYRDEQKKFEADNPEYGDYEHWKSWLGSYDGGVRVAREDRAKGNPNFGDAMRQKEKDLRDQGVDEKLIPAELDSWAFSMAAYKAAQGIQDSIYDSPPKSTGDQATVDTIMKSSGGGSGGGSSKSAPKTIAQKVTADLATYEQEARMFDEILRGVGVTGGMDAINNPLMRGALESQFGDLMPTKGKLLTQYLAWRDMVLAQNPNADASPEAFQEVMNRLQLDDAA